MQRRLHAYTTSITTDLRRRAVHGEPDRTRRARRKGERAVSRAGSAHGLGVGHVTVQEGLGNVCEVMRAYTGRDRRQLLRAPWHRALAMSGFDTPASKSLVASGAQLDTQK